MSIIKTDTGFFKSGLPFNRMGKGPKPLFVLQGLTFENQPMTGFTSLSISGTYKFLEKDYTIYVVGRRPGLPVGYSFQEMAGEYARTIREEFSRAVDVIGLSTGGGIALYLAADYPDQVRKLVLHSSACRLSQNGKDMQLKLAGLAEQHDWRAAYALIMQSVLPRNIFGRALSRIIGRMMASSGPADPSDLIITIQAEDELDFNRQGEIKAPTLILGGDQDMFYDAFKETATRIPTARCIIYTGMGHPVGGNQFKRDLAEFLLS